MIIHPARIGPFLMMLLTSSVSAGAQETGTTAESSALTVEIAVMGSAFPALGIYAPGARVTIARRTPFAFELGIDWTDVARRERYVDQLMWFYFWQVKQSFAAQAETGPRFFVTYGTAGWVERSGEGAGANRRFKPALIPPLFPTFGAGGQAVIGKYAAVRVEAQLVVLWGEVPVTGRLSGGVSIPLGHYR